MKVRLLMVAAFLAAATSALAHRSEGYLQASILTLGPERLTLTLALTPGHDVASMIAAHIDTNKDGRLSDTEMRRYAESLRSDLELSLDGQSAPLTLDEMTALEANAFLDGQVPLQLTFSAAVPQNTGRHRLVYENSHFDDWAIRLVNLAVPERPIIAVAQERSRDQRRFAFVFDRR